MRLFLILSTIWMLVLSFNVRAKVQRPTEIRFITEIMSPFQVKERGRLTGFAVEIIDEVITRVQPKTRIEVYPWARAYNIALNEPNVFIFTLVKIF